MINPVAPNSVREIVLKYVADENGDVSVSINATGFEDDPDAVGLYLAATISVVAAGGGEHPVG